MRHKCRETPYSLASFWLIRYVLTEKFGTHADGSHDRLQQALGGGSQRRVPDVSAAKLSPHDNLGGARMQMPCSAHRRKTDIVRPGGMADVASMGVARVVACLPTPVDARRETTTSTPETSNIARGQCRSAGAVPIHVVFAHGRPRPRIKEASCVDGRS